MCPAERILLMQQVCASHRFLLVYYFCMQVLAFPCNQFGGQEPGTHDEILKFAHQFDNADEKYDFFEKGDVNGANTRQVFSFLKQKLPNEDGTNDIRWNFNIFLVDQEGNPTQRFQPSKTPYDELKPNIEELLKKAEKQNVWTILKSNSGGKCLGMTACTHVVRTRFMLENRELDVSESTKLYLV